MCVYMCVYIIAKNDKLVLDFGDIPCVKKGNKQRTVDDIGWSNSGMYVSLVDDIGWSNSGMYVSLVDDICWSNSGMYAELDLRNEK